MSIWARAELPVGAERRLLMLLKRTQSFGVAQRAISAEASRIFESKTHAATIPGSGRHKEHELTYVGHMAARGVCDAIGGQR